MWHFWLTLFGVYAQGYAGVNGASFVHSGSSHCLVGPGCGENNRGAEQSQSSPQPGPRGGRHLSELSDTGAPLGSRGPAMHTYK